MSPNCILVLSQFSNGYSTSCTTIDAPSMVGVVRTAGSVVRFSSMFTSHTFSKCPYAMMYIQLNGVPTILPFSSV